MNFDDPGALLSLRLEERNKIADRLIDQYSSRHGLMDVCIGLVGLIPGASIPALMAAIAAQAPVIYQPLARRLAQVYLASPQDLAAVEGDIIPIGVVAGSLLDIIAEYFGTDFIAEIISDLLVELGIGVGLSFVPILGAIAGASLDWIIATKLTKRVGLMTAIYYQNGAAWIVSRKNTYEIAKRIQDVSSVRSHPTVRDSLVKNVRVMIEMMRPVMTNEQIREALLKKRVPADLIDLAFEF